MKKIIFCLCIVGLCFGLGYFYGVKTNTYPSIISPNVPFDPVTSQTFFFSGNNEYNINKVNSVISLSQTIDIENTYLLLEVSGTCSPIEVYNVDDEPILLETFKVTDSAGCDDKARLIYEGQFTNHDLKIASESNFEVTVYLAAAGGDL